MDLRLLLNTSSSVQVLPRSSSTHPEALNKPVQRGQKMNEGPMTTKLDTLALPRQILEINISMF